MQTTKRRELMHYLEKNNIQSIYHRNVHLRQMILLNNVTTVCLIKFEKKNKSQV